MHGKQYKNDVVNVKTYQLPFLCTYSYVILSSKSYFRALLLLSSFFFLLQNCLIMTLWKVERKMKERKKGS